MKKLIYKINLTSAYTECPYCGQTNSEIENGVDLLNNQLFICSYCKNEMQGIDERKSSDYKAVEWYLNKYELPHGGQSEEIIKKAKDEYAKYRLKNKGVI
jgi:transposase-like protein